MVSGALLLERNEDVETVLKQRVCRMVLALILASGVVYSINDIDTISANSSSSLLLMDFIRKLLSNTISGSGAYWYLYSYIGFLCVLPLLQRMAKNMNKQEFAVIMVVHFINSSFFPLLNVFLNKLNVDSLSLTGYFYVPFSFSKAFFYPLVGFDKVQ